MPTAAYGPYTTPFSSPFPSPFPSPKTGPHGRAGLNLRTLIKLVLAAFFCLYLITLVSWRRPDSPSAIISELLASNFSLARAPAAVHLEELVDSSPLLGICYRQKAMLQDVPDYVCEQLQCLWVEHLHLSIDLTRTALGVLPGPSDFRASQCALPRGGQGPVPWGRRPHVSFILTMHNHAYVTAQCLLELFRTSQEVPSAEYVVIDDGSSEDTAPLTQALWRLQHIFGVQVRFKRNEEAMGYGPANEQGIHLASGKYIALINNDMFAIKGWLSAIMQTFEANPKAGIVGPLFMGDNDLVTEAGGLVFNDASAANYARGKPPQYDVYFMRKTDYVSAACVVFSKDTYEHIGGFDPQYVMGYYEDTDLAMAVRKAGLDVVFQPLAVNFHQEGTTFGTDSTSELKQRLMAENKEKFLSKWRDVLQEKHCPPGIDQLYAFNRAAYLNLLWIDDIVPEPDKDAASLRAASLIKVLLDAGYGVTVAHTAGGHDPRYATQLRHMGVQVVPDVPASQWMLSHASKCMFDVILVARTSAFEATQGQVMQHCPATPLIYDVSNLAFLQNSRVAIAAVANSQGKTWDFESLAPRQVLGWLDGPSPEAKAARRMRDIEFYFIGKSNLTLVSSQEEADVIHHYRPGVSVAVVSNVAQPAAQPQPKCEQRVGTLFVGSMDLVTNRQAIKALVRHVLPLVVKDMPEHILRDAGFRVHIATAVGSAEPTEELKELFKANEQFVVYHGQLSHEELEGLYGKARVAVAPFLSGAGVQGEVNQAMQLGLPLVSTPIGVEGIDGQDAKDCLIASSPEQFAEKVVQLHTDCYLWRRLSEAGSRSVQERFSVGRAREAFLEALRSMSSGPLPDSFRGTCRAALPAALVPGASSQQ